MQTFVTKFKDFFILTLTNMKKLLFLMMAALSLDASAGTVENVLWNDTYVDGVELNAETVATFKAGNTLRVYVTVPEEGANFKIVYKGAPDWNETTIPSINNQWPWVNGGETYKEFTLTDEDITALAGKNIYIYKGDNSTITKVSLFVEEDDGETATSVNLLEKEINSMWPKDDGVTPTTFIDGTLTMGTYAEPGNWCGAGWWLATWDGATQTNVPVDYSAYETVTIIFAEATATNGGMSIKYNEGDNQWIGFEEGATSVSATLDAERKSAVMEITIQGPQGAIYQIAAASVSGTATGIVGIDNNAKGKNSIYSLSGQRLAKPTRDGIYIVDGKKVIMK